MPIPGVPLWSPSDKVGCARLKGGKVVKWQLQYHARADNCLNSSSSWQRIWREINGFEGHCVRLVNSDLSLWRLEGLSKAVGKIVLWGKDIADDST